MALRTIRVPGVYRRTRPRTAGFPRLRTDVAGFVGVAGPNRLHEPVVLNDWREFEREFLTDAHGQPLAAPPGARLADEVRAFFTNGGARCWVVNVASAIDANQGVALLNDLLGLAAENAPVNDDGVPLPRGVEAMLRNPEVAILAVADLFATITTETARDPGPLPPRFEEGAFGRCAQFAALDTVPAEQLPPARADEGLLLTEDQIEAAQKHLLSRCDRAKFRVFLLLAPPPGLNASQVTAWRERLGTWDGAALYWPWVRVQEVPGDAVVSQAPTGAVAGLFARFDLARGPHRAPAGERLVGVVGTELPIDDRLQAEVYARGVNVVRAIPRRGMVVWGARTLRFSGVEDPADSTSDLLGYVNVRRCLSAIERTAERVGQLAVFQPHTALLRLQTQQAISGYLAQLFDAGVLSGASVERAFYVKCDAELNPPEWVERGQLVCEVGVAIAAPAEFIVFRLGRREGVVEIEEV